MAFKNSKCIQEYVYDFSVDGGAVSSIALSAKANKDPLPAGAIVMEVTAKVLTTCTSGGSATLSWGNTADVDGYSGAAVAVASLTAGSVFRSTRGGALLWDDTNDAALGYAVTSTANTADFIAAIATAALTAGKVVFVVEYLYPEAAA